MPSLYLRFSTRLVPRQSSPRLRHGRRLALLFHSKSNLKTVYSLLHSITDSPLLSSSPHNFPQCSLWKSSLIVTDYLRSRFSVFQPKATSLSSVEPCAWRSLTRPSALLSPPLKFLQLPPIFPLPLAQTRLLIPC